MKLPEPNAGGDFTPTPAGQHIGILVRLIDLGTQKTMTQWGEKHQRKLLFAWEVPAERITFERDGREEEGPLLHFERMTFSSHENSMMRQRLESWRGRPFAEEDFGNFEMHTLLGVPALFQIAHKQEGQKTYANMQSILYPPKGTTVPQHETDFIYVSLEPNEFDADMFDKLSDGLKATIQKSPEWKTLAGPAPTQDDGQQQYLDASKGGESSADELSDEIPF